MEPYEITFLLPKQTQMKGHTVFIAQYATATCCRGCSQKWHRIEKGKTISDSEIKFVVGIKGFGTNDFIGVHLQYTNKNSDILNSGFYLWMVL
jgi:hypothetical protein